MKDHQGRTATAYLSSSESQYRGLKELFRCSEELGLDAGVNNEDINGDTALHFAMLWSTRRAVKLLLEKGADVLGVGYEGTTVLMKPFLSKDVLESTYDGIPAEGFCGTDEEEGLESYRPVAYADADASVCLQFLLDAVLLHGMNASAEAAAIDGEPAAKRQRLGTE
jgi:hypothetical protein